MTITNGYATRDELKAWKTVSATTDDAIIDLAVTSASRGIDYLSDRAFFQAAGARVFDTCNQRTVEIDDAVQVTAVATDDNRDGVYETVWSASDYQPIAPRSRGIEPWPYTKIRAINRQFPYVEPDSRIHLIQVTAIWGWATVPAGIKQACLILASKLVRRKDSPEGVAGFSEIGAVVRIAKNDPDVMNLIAAYDSTSVLVG